MITMIGIRMPDTSGFCCRIHLSRGLGQKPAFNVASTSSHCKSRRGAVRAAVTIRTEIEADVKRLQQWESTKSMESRKCHGRSATRVVSKNRDS